LAPVLYELYFLPSQFYFISKLVHVVWENTEMVPPSNFLSKTNVQPRHLTGVGVHAWHLSPWHTSTLTWLPFFFIILAPPFYIFIYIYIYIYIIWDGWHPHFGLSHPQGTISYTYSNHRGHIMKFIKLQEYIWEKKFVFK
jgi:hypothetical protein